MRVRTLCLVLVAVALGAVLFATQDRPNLSGVWGGAIFEADRMTVSQQRPSSCPFIVKHDGSALAIEGQLFLGYVGRGVLRPHNPAFNINGPEFEIGSSDGKTVRAKAVWEGNTLVVTVYDPERKADIRRQTWAIRDGHLVIITEMVGPDATDDEGRRHGPWVEVWKRC
jgi:hypothetical protein